MTTADAPLAKPPADPTCPKCSAPYAREPGRTGIRLCRKCGGPVDADPGAVSHALDWFVEAVVQAVVAYDLSGDHRHAGSPVPGDCIRCNVLAALPPAAVARATAALGDRTCPKCRSLRSNPCGRGGRRCIDCGTTYGAD